MKLRDPIDLDALRDAAALLIERGIPDDAAAQALAAEIDRYVRLEWLAALQPPLGAVAAAILEALDGPAALWLARRALRWARRRTAPEPGPVTEARAILAEHDGAWLREALDRPPSPGDSPAVLP